MAWAVSVALNELSDRSKAFVLWTHFSSDDLSDQKDIIDAVARVYVTIGVVGKHSL